MTQIDVELIESTSALKALESEWWSLWRRCPSATPFQSPAWLIAWWSVFGGASLRALAARRSGDLIGLAPLQLTESEGQSVLLPIGAGISDYLDFLIDPVSAEAILGAFAAVLPDLAWDALVIDDLPADSVIAAAPRALNLSDPTPHCVCPTLRWKEANDPLAAAPARKRRQLRRARASLARLGAARIEDLSDRGDEFLDHLLRLHAMRWRSRSETGVLCDPRVEAFHRKSLPDLSASKLARCYGLFVGAQCVAAFYGLAHGKTIYAYIGGFDPAYEDLSPGSILIGHALVEGAARGAAEFDFLRGGEAYKYAWGASDRWTLRTRSLRRAP